MYRQVLEKIASIMIDELGIDHSVINENSKMSSDLDINSLELLNVIMAVEEDYKITLEEERIKKVKTVGDLARYIESKL